MIDDSLELDITKRVVDKHARTLAQAHAPGLDELLQTLRRGVHELERVRRISFEFRIDEGDLVGQFFVFGKRVDPV